IWKSVLQKSRTDLEIRPTEKPDGFGNPSYRKAGRIWKSVLQKSRTDLEIRPTEKPDGFGNPSYRKGATNGARGLGVVSQAGADVLGHLPVEGLTFSPRELRLI